MLLINGRFVDLRCRDFGHERAQYEPAKEPCMHFYIFGENVLGFPSDVCDTELEFRAT